MQRYMAHPKPTNGTIARDAVRTRENILGAAQQLFARKGYTTVGVREVAAEAGVNSTLIRRYFGSKEGLFRAAVEDFLQVEPFTDGPRAEFGERAVALLKYGEEIPSALAMMMHATADPEARALCSALMHARIDQPLADWLGGEKAMARATQINLLWIGYMAARQVLPLPALTSDVVDETRHWLAVTIQALVDGDDLK
jgi:AcrR family transcriptional regulator